MRRVIGTRGSSRLAAVGVAVAAVAGFVVGLPGVAGASSVDAQGVALSVSATCAQGDVEVTYSGTDIDRQMVEFTSVSGAVLDQYDVRAYSPEYQGTEYVLSQTATPPPTGTIVAVHVVLGTSPPSAGSGEFFIAYTCDANRNDRGGHNVVLQTCAGAYGTCPKTAAQAFPTATAAPVATPVTGTPSFTG